MNPWLDFTTHSHRRAARAAALAAAVTLARGAWAVNDVAGHFVDMKANGAWSWFQDPRVIIDNNQLIFGSVAGTTNSFANAGDIQVSSYNFGSGLTNVSTLSPALESDDHDVPALTVLPDGRYMAIYQKHGGDNLVRWRISTNPGSTASWNAEVTGNANPLNDGNGNTYANPFYLSVPNEIVSFSRSVGYDTNYSVFTGVNATNDSTLTYNYGGHFLVWNNPNNGVNGANGGAGRPYVKYASNGTDTIWFTNTEDSPDNYWNSIYAGYIKFNAAGAGTVYKSDGTLVGPLSTTSGTTQSYSPQAFTKIFDGTTNNGANAASWTNSMALDSSGHPYAVFSIRVNDANDAFKANDLRYYYTRFDGTTWQTHLMGFAGSPLYSGQPNYAGLAAVDPQNPNVVFISTNYTPDTDAPLAHYEIYQGTSADGGATWTWTAITSNSTVDNIRPIVPAWSGVGTRPLVWLRGTYTSYTSYDMDVVGTLPLPAGANYWNASTGGAWTTAANWTVGVPNAAGAAAFFGNGMTPPAGNNVIAIDGTRTLGSITFDDPSFSYNLISGAAGALALNNPGGVGILAVNRGSHTIAVPITIDGGVNVTAASAAALTISGSISGSGGLSKSGVGTLVLTGSNTYNGATAITGGILLADGVALPSTNLSINGGTLASSLTRASGTAGGQIQLPGGSSGFSAENADIAITLTNGGNAITWGTGTFNPSTLILNNATAQNNLTLTANINLGSTARSISVGASIATLNGVLSGTSGLTKAGTGTLVLTGTSTYTGATTVNAGTLSITGALTNTSGITFNSSGSEIVRVAASAGLGSGTINIASDGSAVGPTSRLEITGDITLANGITLAQRNNSSVAIENLSGNNTLSGPITIIVGGTQARVQSDAGQLTLSNTITTNATSTRNLYLQGAGGGTVSGAIKDNPSSSAGKIVVHKEDTGVWTLSGTNTYTGGTIVDAGALIIANAAVRPPVGVLTINSSVVNGSTIGGQVVLGGAAVDFATYAAALKAAYGTGAWNGSSSVITTTGTATGGLGYMTGATWQTLHAGSGAGYAAGYTTGASDLLISYTYMGDADLSGTITLADYALIDAAFLMSTPSPQWVNGDFNYDGAVDYKDYAIIDAAFTSQGSPLAAALVAQHTQEFGADYLADFTAAAPEPAALGLLSAGATVLGMRRRSRRMR